MTEVERFERFCALVGLDLEPFQREGDRGRPLQAPRGRDLQPRGNGKTTLLGCYAL